MADYNVIINGDCGGLSNGSIELFPTFGTGPYTVDWYNPNLGVDTLVPIGGSSIRTGLAAGLYQIEVTDSTTPPNNYLYVNLIISSGSCVSIISTTDANCGGNNGSLTVSATTSASPTTYYLYSYNSVNTPVFVTSATTSSLMTFSSLSGGTYYVEVFDSGGCSSSTGTCVIGTNSDFDFGLYPINNSNCSGLNTGAIFITGLTGNPPYVYNWSNGQTTDSITGLTNGSYSVTVTDSNGCSVSRSTTIQNVPLLGIINFVNTSPTCFEADGEIMVNISGGTPPYYYQFSNGDNSIEYASSKTYTGLTAGPYSVVVTDASLCVVSGTTSISTPNAFTSVIVTPVNSRCSSDDGSITITAAGGNTPYTFQLTDSFGNTITQTTAPSASFNGLASGVYEVVVTNASNNCTFSQTVSILNDPLFNVTVDTTGTTCNNQNGQVTVNVDVPGTYTYQLGSQIIGNSNLQSVTFSSLAAGYYTVYVTDANPNNHPCTQKVSFLITSSTKVGFVLNGTDCGTGNDGTITALITNGTPPFTLTWSPNVGAQTGIYVTGLSGGTYSLTVTDGNGCTLTKSTTISCNSNIVSYSLFNVCESDFKPTTGTELGLGEMLNDGYQVVTSGETGCSLTSADFILTVNVGGSAYTSDFYTTTSLLQPPTVNQYVSALTNILHTIPGFGSITINTQNNSIQLNSDCQKTLADKNVTIQVKINYNVCCDLI